MSIQAAQRLGAACVSLDASENTSASQVAPALVGALNDPEALAKLIGQSRHITLENEFIPAAALAKAFEIVGRDPGDLMPGIATMAVIQDKLKQREALRKAGVPSPAAWSVEDMPTDLEFPLVLKSRFGGYDGKGTQVIKNRECLPACETGRWLVEEFVPFRRELAVMVLRTANQTVRLQTVESIQPELVCDTTHPAYWNGEPKLSDIPEKAIEAIGGNGLFGVEMFELESGEVLVNEIAPRPHNTGHYSLDWGGLSQFDLHVRAVLGLAIPPKVKGSDTIMVNLIGRDGQFDLTNARRAAQSAMPEARIHWYGKGYRAGRKVGHINLPGAVPEDIQRMQELREVFFSA